MTDLRGKIIWITGASSGIGEALAVAFAKEGAFPVLSARDVEKLLEVKTQCLKFTPKCWIQQLDLMVTNKLEEAVSHVINQTGKIDLLVNNAGQSQRSLAIETPLEIDRHILELNFFSVVALTKLVLPHMLKQEWGHIVVISSISGKFGSPSRTAYSASKHALQGYFESLRVELDKEPVNVTIVSPGRIRTDISLHAVTKSGRPYNKMDPGQANGMDAGICARKIVKAVKKERKELLVGGKELLMVYIRRFFPALYYKMIVNVGS